MTAYEMRISDWSSDLCSSDLDSIYERPFYRSAGVRGLAEGPGLACRFHCGPSPSSGSPSGVTIISPGPIVGSSTDVVDGVGAVFGVDTGTFACSAASRRSEEHTSELQSLMRISYAVFCLKKKKNQY